MWVGVLWAGLRVAMCFTHVGGASFAMSARKATDNLYLKEEQTCFCYKQSFA